MQLEDLFNKLWEQYTQESPESKKIYNLFTSNGENITNDHIAFRTFDNAKININKLSQINNLIISILSIKLYNQ
jgi:hypothetical protein